MPTTHRVYSSLPNKPGVLKFTLVIPTWGVASEAPKIEAALGYVRPFLSTNTNKIVLVGYSGGSTPLCYTRNS